MSDFNKIEKDNINVLSPFKLLVLQNFPFIEADFDAITNYQLMCKMTEYMNNINTNVNTLNENENRVYDAFNNLVYYINNYFANLDVQEEINNKLDTMTEDGTLGNIINGLLQPYIDNINAKLTEQDNKIDSVTSANPLVASSVSEMTDTTRVYVNTTDGNWYYYDAGTWKIGGSYQALGIGNDTVDVNNLTDFKKIFFKEVNADNVGWMFGSLDINKIGAINQRTTWSTEDVIHTQELIYMPKGSVINFNTYYKVRVCLYDLETKNYNSANGYTVMESYTIPYDCYIRIAIAPADSESEHILISDGNNTNVIFKGYVIKYKDETNIINNFCNGSFSRGLTFEIHNIFSNYNYLHRMCMPYPHQLDYDLLVKVDEGYEFGVLAWTSIEECLDLNYNNHDSFVSDTGWRSEYYIIPAGTVFTLSLRKNDNDTTNIYPNDTKHIHLSRYNDIETTDDLINKAVTDLENRIVAGGQYKYNGEKINTKKYGYDIERIFDGNINFDDTTNNQSQGIAMYNGVLFQAFNPNKLKLYSYPSGEVISNIDATIGHGDCIEFSNEFFANTDLYPLLYSTSDTNPAVVYINRVTNNSSTLVRTLNFPLNKTGYYAGHCTDFEKGIMYQVGYKNNSYREDDGTNKMIVSAWNINNLSQVSAGVYTPEFIKSFELPFMITVQGQKFFDNKLFLISSDYGDNTNTIIYAVDPYIEKIVTEFTEFPTLIKKEETEDIAFYLDNNKYDAVISSRDGNNLYFFKCTFN